MVTFTMEDENVESKTTGKSFEDLYILGMELGRGMFSVVHSANHKSTQTNYAIKIIDKPEMEEFDKRCLVQEIDVLSELRNDHIIRLYDVFDAPDKVYMVLEMVHGGELLDRLIQKSAYTEREARDVCKIVMEAMQHCHDHQIAHRDLKPENLLLANMDDDTTLKIADFGFAKKCPTDHSLRTQCGSAMHVAPEILLNHPYGTKVDMWALGVIHYTLIGGRPPFWAEDNQKTFQLILKRDFVFPEQLWGHVHEDCKEMINGLLTLDPSERWSTRDVLNCQWMHDDAEELGKHSLQMSQEELKTAKKKVKFAVQAVMGLNRLQYDGSLPEEEEEPKEEQVAEIEAMASGSAEMEEAVVEAVKEVAEEFLENAEAEREAAAAEREVLTGDDEEIIEEFEETETEVGEEGEYVITRDVYTAYCVEGCEEEPLRKDYFALAQTTGNYFATVLKAKYGEKFDVVEMTLRKSLYEEEEPSADYNVYVEWDITAHFNCSKDKLPPRREICTSLVMSNLEQYILKFLQPMGDSAFGKTTNVYIGHYAF